MKKNEIHNIFNYFVGFCMLFTSAGALAEGGGGGGGSGEIIPPVATCVELGYMIDVPDVPFEPVSCGDFLGSPTLAETDTWPPAPDDDCTVYTYTPGASADIFSLPVRAELAAAIYGDTTLTFHKAGVGDAAQYLKGDILHRVAEIVAAGTITIVVASEFFIPEHMIVRFKNLGGGKSSNYCTVDAPVKITETIFQTPIVPYENTLKVEERVVKNGKCNVRIQGTCNLAKAVGWKCTDAGRAFVGVGGGCQTDINSPGASDDPYSATTGVGATYCEFKEVEPLQLSATVDDGMGGTTPLFDEVYNDGEEQCNNENPITNAGEQSFSCFWWASPPFCF